MAKRVCGIFFEASASLQGWGTTGDHFRGAMYSIG